MGKNKIANFVGSEKKVLGTALTLRKFIHEPTGFEVTFVPMPGRVNKYAHFTVPYGSNSLNFRDLNYHGASAPAATYTVPAGTAHYLEHCVFSRDEDGGMLNQMAMLGFDANAFTSNYHTEFYMSGPDFSPNGENFLTALDAYFKALMRPEITAERVEAERKIILAEYNMYLDDPEISSYLDLMNALFKNHPQKIDICGTIESITTMTAENLQPAIDNFYLPNKIKLTLAGELPEEAVLTMLDRRLAELLRLGRIVSPSEAPQPEIILPSEPFAVNLPTITVEREVGIDAFMLGIKDPMANPVQPLTGRQLIERRLVGQILGEILLGDSSPSWHKLSAAGLINDSFACQYICEPDAAFWFICGDSHQPQSAVAALSKFLQTAELKVSPEVVAVETRAVMGSWLASLDSVGCCGSSNARLGAEGLDLADFSQIAKEIMADLDKIIANFAYLSDEMYYCTVYVNRKE